MTVKERVENILKASYKARNSDKERYGQNWYVKLGAKGGSKPTEVPKGFAANRELASRAGSIGGKISVRRRKDNAEKV